jgi:hypothetical protein
MYSFSPIEPPKVFHNLADSVPDCGILNEISIYYLKEKY